MIVDIRGNGRPSLILIHQFGAHRCAWSISVGGQVHTGEDASTAVGAVVAAMVAARTLPPARLT